MYRGKFLGKKIISSALKWYFRQILDNEWASRPNITIGQQTSRRDDIDPLSVRQDAQWDVTVVNSLADPYVAAATREAEVAEQTAVR